MKLLLYFCLITWSYANTNPWKIVSTGILEQVNDVVIYEAQVPVVFEISMPVNPKSKNLPCNNPKDIVCTIDKEMKILDDEIEEEVYDYNSSHNITERQLGILAAAIGGAVLSPVISSWTHSLFGGNDDLKDSINNAQDRITSTQKSVIRFEKVFNNFSSSVGDQMRTLHDRLNTGSLRLEAVDAAQNEHLKKLFQLVSKQLITNHITLSIEQCKNNFIPHRLVSHHKLKEILKNISSNLLSHNLKLAIPLTNMKHYYNLAITECKISKETIFVVVKIPLIRTPVENWQTYKIIPTRFAHFNETCSISFDENDYLVSSSKTRVVTVRHGSNSECDIKGKGMCLISPQTRDSVSSEQCALALLKSVPLIDLTKSCKFECERNRDLSFRKINQNRIIFTNVKSLEIICPNERQHFNYSDINLGAVDVYTKCNCYIIADGTFIPPIFPCIEQDTDKFDIFQPHQIFPDLWTSFPSGVGLDGNFFTPNITALYNQHWSRNFTTVKVEVDDFKGPEITPFYVNTGIGIWSMAVTFCFILLGTFTFLLWRRLNILESAIHASSL